MTTRANFQMKSNVEALLKARHQTREDLSKWCRKEKSWASKILNSETRWFPNRYWDKLADFFGLLPYQLLQPGISMLTERRRGDRRSGRDRRLRNTAVVVHGRLPLARAIADDLFRLDEEDLTHLAAQLAEVKLRKIGGSSTRESRSGSASIEAGGAPIHGVPKRRPGKRQGT